ncbi:RNA polymerase sigma factor [Dactylosporangium sp. NPDC051485]|uniref:RNA polymerase sigma factor n=1 Tax=Dactylosporangium sp. NPDC051485 TaxID=3154846 RepID=UPI003444253C
MDDEDRNVWFTAVYEAHQHEILGYLYGLRLGRSAEDAWQETFLEAWEQAHVISAFGNVRAWLFKVARRRAIDELRRRKRHAEPRWPLPIGVSVSDAKVRHELEFLHRVADYNLTSKELEVLYLQHVYNFSDAEIATVIGKSSDSVRKYREKAHKKIAAAEGLETGAARRRRLAREGAV